jgi:hypothetical protein
MDDKEHFNNQIQRLEFLLEAIARELLVERMDRDNLQIRRTSAEPHATTASNT